MNQEFEGSLLGSPVETLEDYLHSGGMKGLKKALKLSPGEVISEINASNLRGRGGGAFPTWKKMEGVSRAAEKARYVIINAMESGCGCFKDRELLRRNPFRVFEGALISAYAVSAGTVILPLSCRQSGLEKRLGDVLGDLNGKGFFGRGILGSSFDCIIETRCGGEALSCGEETALLEFLEGRRAIPREKPPFPDSVGLYGKPTLVSNAETFAHVPGILLEGGSKFSGSGRVRYPGSRVVSISGRVRKPGVYEFPAGTTVQGMLDAAGGALDGEEITAVTPCGVSSGFLPRSLFNTPMDPESFRKIGVNWGPGALIAYSGVNCIVNLTMCLARYFAAESCGKCTPCREGTRRIFRLLQETCERKHTPRSGKSRMPTNPEYEPEPLVRSLGETMRLASRCSLGRLAGGAVLSGFTFFREEFRAHFEEFTCPAGVCGE